MDANRRWLRTLLLVLCTLGLSNAKAVAQEEVEAFPACGMPPVADQSFAQNCSAPFPAWVDPIDTTEVLIVFARVRQDISNDYACANDSVDDGWPIQWPASALPAYGNRLVCPSLEAASDPDSHAVYPYRGNLTHFYYDMSGGKHIVWGRPFPRAIFLRFNSAHYDSLDGSPNETRADGYS